MNPRSAPRALRQSAMLAALLLVTGALMGVPAAAAQHRAVAFPTAVSKTPASTPTDFVVAPHAGSEPDRLRAPEPTYWLEGTLVGATLTALLLSASRWLELPGAVILVPLGATVGALVGGQFPK